MARLFVRVATLSCFAIGPATHPVVAFAGVRLTLHSPGAGDSEARLWVASRDLGHGALACVAAPAANIEELTTHPLPLGHNNVALTLQAQGDLSGARALQEQGLAISRRVSGEEHPDTLTATNNLALTLRAQGDLNDARALQEQALAIRRRVLDEEHPDTTVAAFNLFQRMCALDELASARALLQTDLLWLVDRDPATLSADQWSTRPSPR